MIRRWVVPGLVVGFALGAAPMAMSLWSAPGAGDGVATSGTVNAGNAPSATVSADTVTLTWAASTLSSGEPVDGYILKRYDSTGTTEQTIASGTCASQVSGTTCDETSAPEGTWTYSVTPAFQNWRGAESTETTVTVDATAAPPAPTITSAPASPTASTSASFSFTDTFAAQFTAANSEYLSIPDNSALSMGNHDSTWTGWVYLDPAGMGFTRGLLGKWNSVTNQREWVVQVTTGNRFQLSVSPDGTSITGRVAATFGDLSAGTWYFVAAWHDAAADTLNIQVNDGAVDSIAHSGGVADFGNATFLGRREGSTNHHDGRLDSWGVWKRALTPAERTWLYNSGKGRPYSELGGSEKLALQAWWDLDAESGTRLDAHGANHLTDNNTVTRAAGVPGATFECQLDGGGYSACTSPKSYTGLAAGSHTFDVRAVDGAGNRSTPASHTWTVDTTGPATTISHPLAGSSHNDASYTAGCGTSSTDEICGTASDGAGISSVKISIQEQSTGKYWNGGSAFNNHSETLFDVTGTTSWTYALLASKFSETSYTIRIVATDTLNNASSTIATFRMDRTAPTAAITFPVSGSSYNNGGFEAGCGTATTGDLCGTAGDSGGSGLATVKVSIQRGTGSYWNGTDFGSATEVLFDATGTTSWSSAFAAASFSTDGSYTLRAKALDASGNTSTVASSTFTMDRTAPPVPTITANPTDPSNSASPSFSFTDGESGVSFQCQLDGAGYSACTSPKSYTGVSDGSHTFSVKARDAVGNESSPASYTWTVDATAPTSAITFPVSGSFYNASGYNAGCGTGVGDFCGTASDSGGSGVATVQVSIQQGTSKYWGGTSYNASSEMLFTATGTTSWSYGFAAANFSPDGTYTVRAKATDAAGNITTAVSTFTIDTTAPAGSDIQSTNGSGGTNGRPEAGDTVIYTYTEAMEAASIQAGWSGASTNVVVRINNGGADTMTVWDASNTTQLNLGSLSLGRSDYVTGNVTFGATGTPSTMVKSGSNITITLGSVSDPALTGTAAGGGTMVWTPSASAADPAGNACSTANTSELSGADKEF